MDHMNDDNPHAHALDQDHVSNPLIIIHVTCMITAYGILMPLGIMVKNYSQYFLSKSRCLFISQQPPAFPSLFSFFLFSSFVMYFDH